MVFLTIDKMMKFDKRKALLFTVLLAVLAFTSVGNASEISLDVEWNRTYEENTNFYVQTVKQTSDGGYIIGGGDGLDVRLAKTNPTGIIQWNTTIKNTCKEWGFSNSVFIRQTLDGSYFLSYERKSDCFWDFQITKLDPNGNEQWSHDKESSDFLLMKTDFEGNMLWNKTFGGTENEHSYSVAQTADGGYIIAGETWSYGAGKSDLWLVKTDPQGNMLWHNSFGGPHCDKASFVRQTSDNGYIIAGEKDSACGDGFNFWVIKLKADPIEPDEVSARLESIPAHTSHIPGFGVVFSIGILLVVICLVLGIKRK